ncbi:multiple sugar transport system permease protein [Mycoplasmoides fastidiosum]|uniref:Multiple sugar transport system permease protein n=1 Tax=Mycoplasmoides fastidiosum TaxID=92758 RepID=A0ABU0LYM7_9BACT|nr:sugar ABC transporter permease [Mycoplasmoides fastidiosum]MDQ0513817.1 multiple sugar transport system permease protein [Mycoplasmoides fastidiosum]UUD37766.1 sugar ABC transporter permease [Mycoplasmoides fastidiosum]
MKTKFAHIKLNINYYWISLKLLVSNRYNKIFKKEIGLGILDQRHPMLETFLLVGPSILAILLFTIIPFIFTIQFSLVEAGSSFRIDERSIGFANFRNLVNNEGFWVGARNTIVYSALSVPISLVISILISSAIVHLVRKFAKESFLSIFFMPYITSSVAVAVSFYYMFSNNGIINSILGTDVRWLSDVSDKNWTSFATILIYGVWSNLAFQILILTTAMLGVDKTIYKSASIDGTSKLKQFFKITLPSINRSLTFLITIGIIGAIKVFPLALFNNDPSVANTVSGSTIMLWIYYYTINNNNEFSGAASIILFAIGIATSLILNLSFRGVIKGFSKWSDHRVNMKINRLR